MYLVTVALKTFLRDLTETFLVMEGGKGFFKEQMDIGLKLRLLRTGDADLGDIV